MNLFKSFKDKKKTNSDIIASIEEEDILYEEELENKKGVEPVEPVQEKVEPVEEKVEEPVEEPTEEQVEEEQVEEPIEEVVEETEEPTEEEPVEETEEVQEEPVEEPIEEVIEEESVEETLDKPEKGIVLDLGDFTMNLSDVEHRRYLKANVAVEITNPEPSAEEAPEPKEEGGHGGHGGHGSEPAPDPKAALIAEMEQYKPAIRDAVITVLTSKTSDELATTAGKELAKQQIAESVNGIFDGEREVIRVSFGQFIMQ
jgi:flagellar basal body-associated protein FliL